MGKLAVTLVHMQTPTDTPVLLTIEQVADRLALGRSHVYRLLGSGRLRSLSIGKSRRIALVDLTTFIDQLRREAEENAAGTELPTAKEVRGDGTRPRPPA